MVAAAISRPLGVRVRAVLACCRCPGHWQRAQHVSEPRASQRRKRNPYTLSQHRPLAENQMHPYGLLLRFSDVSDSEVDAAFVSIRCQYYTAHVSHTRDCAIEKFADNREQGLRFLSPFPRDYTMTYDSGLLFHVLSQHDSALRQQNPRVWHSN